MAAGERDIDKLQMKIKEEQRRRMDEQVFAVSLHKIVNFYG